MSDLFLPATNGKFQQRGSAFFSIRSKGTPVVGVPMAFDFEAGGDFNAIMQMMYETMEKYPDVAKIMLTVFYKFCNDKGIPLALVKKHTFFDGSGAGS